MSEKASELGRDQETVMILLMMRMEIASDANLNSNTQNAAPKMDLVDIMFFALKTFLHYFNIDIINIFLPNVYPMSALSSC